MTRSMNHKSILAGAGAVWCALLMGTVAAEEATRHQAKRDDTAGTVTREYLLGPLELPAHTPHLRNLPDSPDGLPTDALPWYFKSDLPLADIELEEDAW